MDLKPTIQVENAQGNSSLKYLQQCLTSILQINIIDKENKSYITHDAASLSFFTRFVLNVTSQLRQFV